MKTYKRKAVATLLDINDRSVSQLADDAGIEIARSNSKIQERIYTLQNIFDMAAHLRRQRLPAPFAQKVVAVNVPKGGTGKSFISVNLATCAALHGIKTMIIDLDYQSSASIVFGYDPDLDEQIALSRKIEFDPDRVINYHVGHLLSGILKNEPSTVHFEQVAKHPFGHNGPTLIPADVTITRLDFELMLSRLTDARTTQVFHRWITSDPIAKDYELVIFDTGPGFNQVINCAQIASHMVLAPIGLDTVSDKALNILNSQIQNIKEQFGASPNIRIIPNMMVNTSRAYAELEAISSNNLGMMLNQPIPRREEIAKSYSRAHSVELLPFILGNPGSDITEVLRSITKYVLTELFGDNDF